MAQLGLIGSLARFAVGLPPYLRAPLDAATCRAVVAAGQAHRLRNFLSTLERAIFARPASPYRRLLMHAGITLADIRQLATADGIEPALQTLYDAGVYVTLDEFKGRKPIVRGSLSLAVGSRDFDNPLRSGQLELQTGGSRSAGTRIYADLAHYAHDAAYDFHFLEAHGHLDRPYALWRPTPPYGAGIKAALSHLKLGLPVERWFTQRRHSWAARGKAHRLLLEYARLASLAGPHRLPRPEHVPEDQAIEVARWLAEKKRHGRPGLLNTTASSGVRVASAALAAGLDIADSHFRFGGEPLSRGKAAVVARAGALPVCHYTMGETGRIGLACACPEGPDDVHMLTDKIAVITRPWRGGTGPSVAINVHSSVQPSTPKLLLNVESNDYGLLQERSCGCSLERLGYRLHMRQIRSVDKLTSEGMTFIGNDLIRLIEEVLPAGFGGGPTDWQLVEIEEDGLPKVVLHASPDLGRLDEAAVLDRVVRFLNEIPNASDDYGERWRRAGTLRLVRKPPIATGASKLLALHIDRPQT